MTHVMGRPHPGTEEWRLTVEALLRRIWNPVGMSPAHLEGIENRLLQDMNDDPEAFLAIQDRVASEFGFATPDPAVNDFLVELTEGLIDALSGAGSAQARTILSNIVENRQTTETQDITTTTTVTGEEEITTERREVEFIEYPTPEEFLDNFQVGLATWVDSLARIGATDVNTRDFALANPQLFLDRYIAELGRRAAEGQNIFEIVGLEGAAERLGERFGGRVTEETTRVGEEQRISDTELEQLIQTTIDRLTTTMADDVPQDITETIRETLQGVFREHRETTTREDFTRIASTLVTEEIFGRPRLAAVSRLSPLDFLRESFAPTELANLAAAESGLFPVERPRRPQPSAPRRLGG